MAKKRRYEFEPQDEGVRYPNDDIDPQDVPENLPASPDFYQGELAPAHSQFSTGRGCPECSGDLKLQEYFPADDVVVVMCKHCKKKYHASDLESDELYRQMKMVHVTDRRLQRLQQGKDT